MNDKFMSYTIVFLISLNMVLVGLTISPYYRMYVNEIGGGMDKAGYYFPQDSVYDYKFREAIEYVNTRASMNSIIAVHIPVVAEYYARADLDFLHILDLPENLAEWHSYNVSYVIVQQSRIYEQNDEMVRHVVAAVEKTGPIESILKRFNRYNRSHPTYKAFIEAGKALKTIHICKYLMQPSLRVEIHEGLNIVENWNSSNSFFYCKY